MGYIENVSTLLALGCDINTISIGKHNYGKTPIFYAITRGREDVIRYLLSYNEDKLSHECNRVNVRIVNNKGQSVYSLAYSHDFSDDILQCIRDREAESNEDWKDYSTSHNDGCIYGDLDLRFIQRPLTSEDVVKNGVVVNPTTKESRRGNFTKNNPSAVHTSIKTVKNDISRKEKHTKMKQKEHLSREQEMLLDQLWTNIAESLQQTNSWDLFSSLLAIVQFWEDSKLRLPWITDSASRLDFLIQFEIAKSELSASLSSEPSTIPRASLLSEAIVYCGSGDRHVSLVKRILSKTIEGPSTCDEQTRRHDNESLERIQQNQLSHFWKEINNAFEKQTIDEIYLALIKPVILYDRFKVNWTQEFSKQLQLILESKPSKHREVLIRQIVQHCESSSCRYASLLRRLLERASGNSNEIFENYIVTSKTKITATSKTKKKEVPHKFKSFVESLQKKLINEQNLEGMPSWNVLMNPYLRSKADNHYFSLPIAPLFVDSTVALSKLESKLRQAAANNAADCSKVLKSQIQFSQLVVFDSEFYTTDNGQTGLATIQFSVMKDDGIPSAWVVDLLVNEGENETLYHSMTCDMLRWLFLESDFQILGFSPRHDLHLLSSYLGENVKTEKVWDLQLLAAYDMSKTSYGGTNSIASLPGLQSCCSHYFDKPLWTLSKEEQCSNWKQRPLSADQLEYAGLDAAVLLVLLSEIVRRC